MIEEDTRVFFVLYSTGDTFYFTINQNGELYCNEFSNEYKKTRGTTIPAAHTLEVVGNNFKLKSTIGETIYSLEQYLNIDSAEEIPAIDMFYIDEDVRSILLATNKLAYDEEASLIPGLLDEPKVEQHYSRTRRPNSK